MNGGVARFGIGTEFHYDGEVWVVTGLDGPTVRARSGSSVVVLNLAEVMRSESFRLAVPEDDSDHAPAPGLLPQVRLASGDARAEQRVRCVYLLTTGFPNGQPDGPDAVPDPEVGPQNGKTLRVRMERLAEREGVGSSSVKRWLKVAREQGVEALTDMRMTGIDDPLGQCPPEVRDAIVEVVAENTNRSRITDQEYIRLVRRKVKDRHGEDYPLPGQRSLERYLKVLRRGRGHEKSTRTRRSIANRPQRMYQPYTASRPFETVEIDSQSLDLFALAEAPSGSHEEGTFVLHKVTLTLAIDVCTRSVVAWRFTVGDPSAQDAMLLLHDMIAPKPYDPAWGPKARWRYAVPENILVLGRDGEETVDIAGVPCGKPDTVVIDNGSIFTSEAFLRACSMLSINIQFSRPYTPTDKPHVERVFHTIKTLFVQTLPGYKGSEPSNRGTREEVEERASMFVWEVERFFAEWVATIYQNRPHKGLVVPGVQRHNLTPNEAFDLGIVSAGFIRVPITPDLAVSLLQPEFRMVRDSGIEVDYLRYDSHDLDPYRGRTSPFTTAQGRWPIRVDRRDLSAVWFWAGDLDDPTVGEWVRIPSVIDMGQTPFSDVAVGYVKGLLTQQGRAVGRHRRSEELRVELEAFLERVASEGPATRKEERVTALDAAKTAMAAVDNVGQLGRGEATRKKRRREAPENPRVTSTQGADDAVQRALDAVRAQEAVETHSIGSGRAIDPSRYEEEAS